MTRHAQKFYRHVLETLALSEIPFLVGGGYAARELTGIDRFIKDLDLFIQRQDLDATLALLEESGCRVEIPYSHWLAKAHSGRNFVDVIFNAGNGLCAVDQAWFENAAEDSVLGVAVKLCPPEETIWQKAFIMERERYDGADVAHLLHACGRDLDWRRLLDRFGASRAFFAHLILFGYVYPGERDVIPPWVVETLVQKLQRERTPAAGEQRVCRGTLLSRTQYQPDTEQWGYADPRLPPFGKLTLEQLADWSSDV